MRALVLAVLALGALAGFSAGSAEAAGYPFCIKGQEYANGTGDCRFTSYAACQAAASGTYSYCASNPFYASNTSADADAPQRKGRRIYSGQAY